MNICGKNLKHLSFANDVLISKNRDELQDIFETLNNGPMIMTNESLEAKNLTDISIN